jgi:hypothetical protein
MLHPRLQTTVIQAFGMPAVKGRFGVELEIEGENLPGTISGWSAKKEDSLRGEALEYVTKGAYDLESLKHVMEKLEKQLTAEGTKVSLSKRASTHIHINMQQEKFHTVLGFVLLWTICEPVTLRLCGPLRNGNLFCMSAMETGDLPNWMYRVAHDLHHPYRPFGSYPRRGKYATLNSDPLSSFGSLEARCFPISITTSEVLNWCQWMENILSIVKTWPDETYESLIDYAYSEPNDPIARVFQQNVFTACQPTNPYDLIHAGVEIAFETLRQGQTIFHYSEKTKPEGKKKTPQDIYNALMASQGSWNTMSISDLAYPEPTPPEDF